MSLWLLTVFFGNMMDAAVTKLDILRGLPFFLFFACLMFLVAFLFIWTAMRYHMRDCSITQGESIKIADGPTIEQATLLPGL